MAKRLAELGALQDAITNTETEPKRLALAGYIRGLFLDWSRNPSNPLSRLTARGRYYGYFWDNGIMPLSLDFANQNYVSQNGGLQSRSFSDIITFSRTSNATITKSDGTIGYAPHNLLTNSSSFDAASWTKTTTTVNANSTISPQNETTADTLTAGGANSTTLHSYTAIAQSYVFSVWIKRRTGTGDIQITADGSTYVTKAITSSWVRYETAIVPTAGTRTPGIRIVTSGDAIDVWGAQLEIGTTAGTYNSTMVKNLLGYTEAFDNAAWTKSNSFVQTNLLTYSEAFDNAAWAKTTITATANSIIAPNGYQTADTLAATGANSTALQTFTASAVPYTFSVYLYRKNGTGNIDITVDGTTWVTKTITAGWTRVDTTFTPAAGSKTAGIRIATSGDEIYAWGAQLVQGSDAGAYRRTDAAALPVFYPNHNGVVCAERLVPDTANVSSHRISITSTSVLGAIYTQSFYVKADGYTWVKIRQNTRYANFNLSTGAVGVTNATSSSIVALSNGWYRVSMTSTAAGNNELCYCYVGVDDNAGLDTTSFAGDGTSGIYIFGAQLSDSASLDPYVLNAAAAPSAQAYYGARFDYDPVTLAPKGLLIEESRVNLLLNSSLDGTNLATQNITTTAAARTLSFYGTGTVTLSGTHSATVNGIGAYPTRTTYTYTPTAGTLTLTVSGNVKYAQDELGSFATSFIPTAGATVTRAADVAVIQGSNFYSWYNQNANSLYARFDTPAIGNRNIIAVDDGSANNHVKLRTEGTDPYLRSSYVGTEMVALDLGAVAANTAYKIATGYSINNYAGVINAGTVGTDITATTPLASAMRLGTDQAGAYLNGHLYSVSSFNSNLPQSTLTGITA